MFFYVCIFLIFNTSCFCLWYHFVYQLSSSVALPELLFDICKHTAIHLKYMFFPKKRSRNLTEFFNSYDLKTERTPKKNRTETPDTSSAENDSNKTAASTYKEDQMNESKSFGYLFFIYTALSIQIAVGFIFPAIIKDMPLASQSVWIVIYICLVLGTIIKESRHISSFLNEYILFQKMLLREAKRRPDVYMPFHIDRNTVKKNLRNNWLAITILAVLAATLICYLIFEIRSSGFRPSHNIIFCGVLLFILAIYILADKDVRKIYKDEWKDKKAQRKERKDFAKMKGLFLSGLDEWETECIQMYSKLHIKKLCAGVEDLKSGLAVSGKDPALGPAVLINKAYLVQLANSLEPSEYHRAVTFILGHEFTHIRHKDYSYRVSAIKQLLLMTAFFTAVIVMSIFLPRFLSDTVLYACQLLLILAIPFTFRILANDRYWKQTAELRADRAGMELSGASWQILEKILEVIKDDTKQPEKQNFISHFINKHSEIDAHPPAELRIRELKRDKSWGFSEYLRYVFILKAWKR